MDVNTRSDDTAGEPKIQSYDVLASEYDSIRYDGHLNAIKENFRRRALEQLLPMTSALALDVACGTGRGLLILREHSRFSVGVDGTFEMLKIAASKFQKPPPALCRANAASLPFPDASFDLATCLNFVHLFSELPMKRQFIAEIGRVLRPGGTAIIEFDNALQGLIIGCVRKYMGKDIGYDWPWDMHSCFRSDMFRVTKVCGANLPFLWRLPVLRPLEEAAKFAGIKYLANRILIQAVRQ
jgi:ubiquinone/menaquinone biosynthesis C-methylase UbiE